ncbi:hypothetical protein Tco_1158073, partial [Tanacetum coccineum]
MVVQNQSQLGEGLAIPTDPHHTPTILQTPTQPQKTQQPRKPTRKNTQVPQPSGSTNNVTDEAVHKELGDSLVRTATTTSSLEAEQVSENMRHTIAQTRFENVSKQSNDSLLVRGNTLQSDEDSLKLNKLMALCTNLQKRAFDLENELKKTKTTQQNEIASLKRRVKKLEKTNRSRAHKLKRLYKVGLNHRVESFGDEDSLGEDASKQGRKIDDIDAGDDITLVSVHRENDEVNVVEEVVEVINTANLIVDVAQVSAVGGQVSAAGDIVSTASIPVSAVAITVSAAITTSIPVSTASIPVSAVAIIISAAITTTATKIVDDVTLAPKKKRVVIQDLGESTTTISSQQSHGKGKGKEILIEEPEPVKSKKRKDQIRLDEEVIAKLQVEFDEEERLAREKAEKEEEANIALIE